MDNMNRLVEVDVIALTIEIWIHEVKFKSPSRHVGEILDYSYKVGIFISPLDMKAAFVWP